MIKGTGYVIRYESRLYAPICTGFCPLGGLTCLGCRRFNEGDQAQAHRVHKCQRGLMLSDLLGVVM